jgi:hypothetical protein
MRRPSPPGLRRTEKRRPGEHPTEGDPGRQGPLPARIKANGREVASRMFDRKSDAVAWEQDQRRRLSAGEWLDPRRGQVPLSVVA